MEKSTQSIVIGLGIASILFAVLGVIRGGETIDAIIGITIGASLIGTILIERNKNKD